MLTEFKLGEFAVCYANLCEIRRAAADGLSTEGKFLMATIDPLLKLCPQLGLLTSEQAISALLQRVVEFDQNLGRVHFSLFEECDRVIQVISMEAGTKHFFFTSPNRAQFYTVEPEEYVDAVFPTCIASAASEDFREALRCYAVESCTACVFHCCRALEAVLVSVVYPSVGSPTLRQPTRPTWGDYLKAVESILAPERQVKTRTATWDNAKVAFYEMLLGDYTKVKDAERASVSHNGKMFSDGRARSLLDHTAALLKDASEHFDDNGQYKP